MPIFFKRCLTLLTLGWVLCFSLPVGAKPQLKGVELQEAVDRGQPEAVFEWVKKQKSQPNWTVTWKNREGNITQGPLLVWAAYTGHLKLVQFLLAQGAEGSSREAVLGHTAFISAASQGYVEVMNYLFPPQIEMNYRNEEVLTALENSIYYKNIPIIRMILGNSKIKKKELYTGFSLCKAASFNQLEVLNFLVESGINVNSDQNYDDSGLSCAAANGSLESVNFLLTQGAKLEEKGMGWPALTIASQKGYAEIVQSILNSSNDIQLKHLNGENALRYATLAGHKDIVKMLLEQTFLPEKQTSASYLALIWASEKGHFEIVQLLIGFGVKVKARRGKGESALISAAQNNHMKIVKLLLDSGANRNERDGYRNTALIWGASKGNLEIVKLLLERGADPNLRNKSQSTALLDAASSGKTEIIQLLINKGADLNAIDNAKNNALMKAAYGGNLSTVQYLLNKGMDPNLKNDAGTTALLDAAIRGNTTIVEALINHGANLNEKNRYGESALSMATSRGYLSLLKLLQNRGADLTEKNSNGQTLLIQASFNKRCLPVMAFLLKQGIDPNEKNPINGETALMSAAGSGNKEAVELLLSYGADLILKDNEGKTVFDHAIWHKDIFDLLLNHLNILRFKLRDKISNSAR